MAPLSRSDAHCALRASILSLLWISAFGASGCRKTESTAAARIPESPAPAVAAPPTVVARPSVEEWLGRILALAGISDVDARAKAAAVLFSEMEPGERSLALEALWA